MSARIIVIGSLNMDLVVRVPYLPRPGETVGGHSFFQAPGGKGANQAVAAAKLGADVSMVGRVGGDAYGLQLLNSLAGAGVNTANVVPDPASTTGLAFIFVDDAAENVIVLDVGANGLLRPSHVDAARAAISASDALLVQLEVPVETVLYAARMARSMGVRVLLNAAPAMELPTELLRLADILVVNEEELRALSGADDAPEVCADMLLKRGTGAVLVTLGREGCLLANAEGTMRVPAFRVKAVDTTAAGDTFVAAYAVALLEAKDPERCLRFACAAAAVKVTRSGAQPGMPSREDVERFMASEE